MSDPLAEVRAWYEEAVAADLPEAEAMALATATPEGRPAVRFVLLKGIDDRGVRFFTNYESRKGRELAGNPRAAATLYWQPLARAVRLAGPVERLSTEESDAYFGSRPRGAQIGAWASRQSTPIPDRAALEARAAEAEARFAGGEVPRPPYWGGYRLVPEEVELWQGRRDRLHDRTHWRRAADGSWRTQRLAP